MDKLSLTLLFFFKINKSVLQRGHPSPSLNSELRYDRLDHWAIPQKSLSSKNVKWMSKVCNISVDLIKMATTAKNLLVLLDTAITAALNTQTQEFEKQITEILVLE